MKFFETVLGIAVAAAVIPYKVSVDKTSEEENAPKKVSVESLVYRVDVTPKETDGVVGRDISLTVPADGIRRIFRFTKEKFGVAREKAVEAKDKVTDKVAEVRERRAAKKAAAADAASVIEVPAEDGAEA